MLTGIGIGFGPQNEVSIATLRDVTPMNNKKERQSNQSIYL
jgi:hypothetical protein